MHTASWSGSTHETPMYCASHAPSGSRMVKYRCVYGLCPVVHATHAPWVGAESRWCRAHRPAGSVNVVHRRCGFIGCPKVNPAFGYATRTEGPLQDDQRPEGDGAPGESRGQYCKTHRLPGMVDVRSRRCGHEGCTVLKPACGFCRRHRDGPVVSPSTQVCPAEKKTPVQVNELGGV